MSSTSPNTCTRSGQDKSVKLLVITNIYPPQNLGGFGLCIERLTEGLKRKGYSEIVLTGDQPELGEGQGRHFIQRELKLLGEYKNGVQNLGEGHEKEKRSKYNLKIINNILIEHKPDACLIGNLDLLGKEVLDCILAKNIPTVMHIGFMGSPFQGNWIPYTKPFRIASASGEVKRLLKTMGHNIEHHPIVYPPLAQEKPEEELKSRCRGDQLRIGFAGLLMHSKGLHVLMEAASKMKTINSNFNITVAGHAFSKQYEEALGEYCKRANIKDNVRWMGFVEPNDLKGIYRDIDVLVFPSLYPEAFGMVVAEAMSNGVLPISSGVGGAFEVITHGIDGLLVPPGDSEALYQQLEWCSRHIERVRNMGRRAQRNAFARFGPERSAEVLDQCFKEIENRENNQNSKTTLFY